MTHDEVDEESIDGYDTAEYSTTYTSPSPKQKKASTLKKNKSIQQSLDIIETTSTLKRIGKAAIVVENPYYGGDPLAAKKHINSNTSKDIRDSEIIQCTDNIYYGST